jgi:hypothetical protein
VGPAVSTSHQDGASTMSGHGSLLISPLTFGMHNHHHNVLRIRIRWILVITSSANRSYFRNWSFFHNRLGLKISMASFLLRHRKKTFRIRKEKVK